jgi:hypothetical protein
MNELFFIIKKLIMIVYKYNLGRIKMSKTLKTNSLSQP